MAIGERLDYIAGMFQQFGVDPWKFVIQLAIYLIPAIWATRRVVARREGVSLASWVLLIWFVPIVGPLLALIAVRGPKRSNSYRRISPSA